MVAPIAWRPFTCWSTGRKPIAQPPGSDTLARPQRASSGPSTSTEARMVFTSSYDAVGSLIAAARSVSCPSAGRCTSTPIWRRSLPIVETSTRLGTLLRATRWSVSSAAHMIGRAAFFAPETRTSPCSARPPVMRSLSTRFPLLGCQRAHRKGMDFLAHALAERRVNQLMALHAAPSRKLPGYDQRLEMLSVADHFHMLAGEPRCDPRLHAFRRHHSIPQLVPGLEQPEADQADDQKAYSEHRQAGVGRHVGRAEEAVAKAIDHVKERVGVRQLLPEAGQRMNRIEHAGKKAERHDDEVLKRRQLIDLFGDDAGDQAERPEQRGSEQRERECPERRAEPQLDEPDGHDEHPGTYHQPADRRGQHVGAEELEVGDRRQQDEHDVAGDFRLDQAG